MLYVPNKATLAIKNGKLDCDGFIAAINITKTLILQSPKNITDIDDVFKQIEKNYKSQHSWKNAVNKTVAELKELVRNKEITIYSSWDPEFDKFNLSIFHYNANYENRFKVIE